MALEAHIAPVGGEFTFKINIHIYNEGSCIFLWIVIVSLVLFDWSVGQTMQSISNVKLFVCCQAVRYLGFMFQ